MIGWLADLSIACWAINEESSVCFPHRGWGRDGRQGTKPKIRKVKEGEKEDEEWDEGCRGFSIVLVTLRVANGNIA